MNCQMKWINSGPLIHNSRALKLGGLQNKPNLCLAFIDKGNQIMR